MTDQSNNAQFHASSFMQGHNAEYLEQLYAQYAKDPNAVDAAWAEFFRAMGDDEVSVKAEAEGPSWARTDWPQQPSDDWTNALTGEWPVVAAEGKSAGKKIADKAKEKGVEVSDEAMKRAVLDSIRAIMLIRAYRVRGHLAADLDPLACATPKTLKHRLIQRIMGLQMRTWIARSSLIMFWASKSHLCARSLISCAVPIAAHSRCNTCISRTPNNPHG